MAWQSSFQSLPVQLGDIEARDAATKQRLNAEVMAKYNAKKALRAKKL